MKLYTFLSILLLLNLVGTKIIKEISCAGEEECDIKFKAFLSQQKIILTSKTDSYHFVHGSIMPGWACLLKLKMIWQKKKNLKPSIKWNILPENGHNIIRSHYL